MDYVLFGMGYGATLMLIGWALRTFGPQLKYNNPEASNETDYQVKRRFWVRFIQGAGGVIALAGVGLVFLTFVVMLINPDDETGSTMALVVWGFLVIGLLLWCYLYVGRFGLTGVWDRDEGYGLRRGSATALSPASASTTSRMPRKRVPAVAPAGTEETTADIQEPVDPESSDEPVIEPDNAEEPASEPDEEGMDQRDPESDEEAPAPSPYDFGDVAPAGPSASLGGRTAALRRLRERNAQQGDPGDTLK